MPSLARFDWDPVKRDTNLRNHGVDFVRAAAIFDGWVLEWSDLRRDNSERRIVAVGSTAGQMLTVDSGLRVARREAPNHLSEAEQWERSASAPSGTNRE